MMKKLCRFLGVTQRQFLGAALSVFCLFLFLLISLSTTLGILNTAMIFLGCSLFCIVFYTGMYFAICEPKK